MSQEELRQQIAELVAQYAETAMAPKPFEAGKSVVPPSGKVIGTKELQLMVEASLDGWLTTGRFNDALRKTRRVFGRSLCSDYNFWLFSQLIGFDRADLT